MVMGKKFYPPSEVGGIMCYNSLVEGSMMKKRKGFTLGEVLIVVVVIGILASLIIPRVMDVPEKSFVQEANHMLSALLRAEQANLAKGDGFIQVTDNTNSAPWQLLGLQPPGVAQVSGSGPKFNYTCEVDAGVNVCWARRPNQNQKWIRAPLYGGGTWSTGSDYSILQNGGAYWIRNS
jgi:prepilin-type N-terminal cleavage/methylation domain-containing protein